MSTQFNNINTMNGNSNNLHSTQTLTNTLYNTRSSITRTVIWHVINCALIALAFGIAVGLYSKVNVRPVTFSLLDYSIAQPYYNDTIVYGALLGIVLIVPLIMYILYGIYDVFYYRGHRITHTELIDDNRVYPNTQYTSYKSIMLVSWLWYYGTLQSLAIAILLTQWIKYYADELRPDFLSQCFPPTTAGAIYTIPTAIQTTAAANNYLLVTTQCTPLGGESLTGEILSFWSGHASTAWAASIYLSIFFYYKHIRVPFSYSRRTNTPSPYNAISVPVEGWRYVLIFIPVVFALWVAASRLYDHKHHIWDVVIGSLVGLICAFVVYFMNYDNYVPINNAAALPYEYETVALNDTQLSGLEKGLGSTTAPTYNTALNQQSVQSGPTYAVNTDNNTNAVPTQHNTNNSISQSTPYGVTNTVPQSSTSPANQIVGVEVQSQY